MCLESNFDVEIISVVCCSLSPYSFDVSPSCSDSPQVTHDSVPIGAIPLLATASHDYQEALSRTVSAANLAYREFLQSDEGRGFNGTVNLIGASQSNQSFCGGVGGGVDIRLMIVALTAVSLSRFQNTNNPGRPRICNKKFKFRVI